MEAAPEDANATGLFNNFMEIREIDEIMDFHVWCLSAGKIAMSAHVKSNNPDKALKAMNKIIKKKYNIYHSTI